MEKAYELIRLIDSELLKLYEASIHKGEYYHFNFKQALINLNREFLKNGLYDNSSSVNSNMDFENTVRDYIDVFNDLCSPEKDNSEMPSTSKFENLIQGCKFNYNRIGILNRKNEKDNELYQLDNIELFNNILIKDYSFDNFFGTAFSFRYFTHLDFRTKISFEDYINSLKADRLMESNLKIEKEKESNSQKEILIENTIKSLNDKLVSNSDLKKIRELITINTTFDEINWLGTYDELVSTVYRWHKNELIIYPHKTDIKYFIKKYFKMNGEEINSGSLNNACTKIHKL